MVLHSASSRGLALVLARCSALPSLLVLFLAAQPWAQASVALPQVLPSRVDAGIRLMQELQCASCHAATDSHLSSRLGPAHAPLFGSTSTPLTPQWIQKWLLNPSASKPGTSMPHVLGQLPESERAGAAESLTHYLLSLLPPPAQASRIVDQGLIQQGRLLYHKVGCVACHAPDQTPEGVTPADLDAVRLQSVPLGDLARKYHLGDLAAFLQNPGLFHPRGRMPSLNLSGSEAFAVGAYLLREQTNSVPSAKQTLVQGLLYEYFEGNFGGVPDFGNHQPVATGQVPAPTLEVRKRNGQFGLRFFGQIQVPRDGEYRFWTTSDDGSRLYVNGQLVVQNDGERPAATKSGKIALKAGLQPIEIRYTQGGGEWVLNVQWAGPNQPKADLTSEVLRCNGNPLMPLDSYDFSVNPTKVEQGRALFGRLNCSACHAPESGGAVTAVAGARPLTEVAVRADAGCLSEQPSGAAARYDLSAAQRQLLRATLQKISSFTSPVGDEEWVEGRLSQLNCYACHQRDGVGGPSVAHRDPWFTVQGEADLGDEGRIPPHLTGVGRKLKPEWLKKVLAEGVKSRPYMATRMPVFGAGATAGLADKLTQVDRPLTAVAEPVRDERDAKWGWKLVGRDGVGCVNCHTFGKLGSMGIPALSLDAMYERLNWEWFSRYLPDPASLRPGTRMPSFWPDGKAVNTEILGGQTEAQIRAIWAYLAGGSKAEVPAGLVRGKKELIPEKEPSIYRNFIEGAGSRAIGVGYPEHVHLAFDANQMRPALFWQGAFIDTARHSTDRGVGYEPPLGDHVIKMPEGPSVAALSSVQAPWPATGGKAAGYHFRGYELDAQRRPTFRYSLDGVEVSEGFLPAKREPDAAFIRTIQVKDPGRGTYYARLASGSIAKQKDGSFVVNGQYRIKLDSGLNPVIQGNELRVRIPATGVVQSELIW